MTSLTGCSGMGWTLVMKIDGRKVFKGKSHIKTCSFKVGKFVLQLAFVAFFATGPGCVLKCISFCHSKDILHYFKIDIVLYLPYRCITS